MSEQFITRLQAQLREAAEREERRGTLVQRLVRVRRGLPGAGALATAAAVATIVAAVVFAGGLDWGGDERTATPGPRVVADVALSDNLGTLTSGFGSVWASDAHGTILRVDPRTRAVRQRIQVGGNDNAPGGTPIVNAGAGAVWAIRQPDSFEHPSVLVRIDPRSGAVTSRHSLRPPGGRSLAFGDVQILGGVPWAIGAAGSFEIDPASGRPVRYVATELPEGEPYPLFAIGDDRDLWIGTRDERILRYGLRSGRLEATLPMRMPNTRGLVPTHAGPVLGNGDGELARIRPEDGAIVWRAKPGSAIAPPLALGDRLYVHAANIDGGGDTLAVVDARSGQIRSWTALPEFGITGMAVVGRELWLSSPNGHVTILRF